MTDEERREYWRKYYAENKERLIARQMRYRHANPEKYRATRSAYRKAHKEKINAQKRERYRRRKAEIWNQLKKGNGNGTRAGT